MPFEPLRTDEKLDKPVKPERDMDTTMLFGCSGFVMTSLATYGLSIWPHFLLTNTHQLATLGMCLLVGLGPAAVLGLVSSRKFGLPGACGFIGGSMATSIFLFLRFEQVMLASTVSELPKPEYPEAATWIVPVAWMVVSAAIAGLGASRAP